MCEPTAERVEELERAVREVITQEADDICWMDVYIKLAKLVGVEFDPALLPKDKFLRNCEHFATCLYEGLPYKSDNLTEAVRERDDLRRSFDLRWKADMRAIKRWREANPGRELEWPDHADMVCFLLDELDKMEGEALRQEERANKAESLLERIKELRKRNTQEGNGGRCT